MEASRFIELEGGYNFRDLGGYATTDNSHIKPSTVFRSAALSSLTPADVELIDRIGIRFIIDLRTTHERNLRPGRSSVSAWTRDYDSSNADLGRLLRNPDTTVAACRATMCQTYRNLPEEQAESYAELLRRIAAGDVPILFHCAVGKDRTGVAAALLLALVGVPRATIEEDYIHTLRVADRLAADARAAVQLMGSVVENNVLVPILDAHPDYLDAMFSEVDIRYGSVENYARQRLGLTENETAAIRTRLLIR